MTQAVLDAGASVRTRMNFVRVEAGAGAFVNPDPGEVIAPRSSVEFRVIALFKD